MEIFIWKKCLVNLQNMISIENFDIYIRPLQVKLLGNVLLIYAPNKFVLNFVQKNYLFNINKLLYNLSFGNIINSKIEIGQENSQNKIFVKQKNFNFSHLNITYNFNNFIIGKCNKLAFFSLKYMLKNLGRKYNPFFIYGNTGLGKTHLLNAIGNMLVKKKRNFNVAYVNSELFVQNLIQSIKSNTIEEFKKYYKSIDILLLDDIQFFSYKFYSQKEFLYTLNFFLERNKQVILTSNVFPKYIKGIHDRLKSRFGWGLTVLIHPFDLKTKINFLLKRSCEYKISLSKKVAYFIAQRFNFNLKELDSILNRLIVNSYFFKSLITIDFVKHSLQDMLYFNSRILTMKKIIKLVSNYSNIKIKELISTNRSRIITKWRQISMTLIKEIGNYSFYEIGKFFNNRDHTTILYAYKKIQNLRKLDIEIQKIFLDLLKLVT